MIKTKEFSFTKGKYFQILLKNSLKKNLWTVLFLLVITIYQATKGMSKVVLFLATLPTLFFLYLVIRCWVHATAKKNKFFFKDRALAIDEKMVQFVFKEGAGTSIQINDISRVIKKSSYYLLFLSKRQFIYIPLNAFKTSGDIQRFDSILKARKHNNNINVKS